MAIEEVTILRCSYPFELSPLTKSLCRNFPLRFLTRKRMPSLAVSYILENLTFRKLIELSAVDKAVDYILAQPDGETVRTTFEDLY